MGDETDELLLDAARAGDPEAFRRLWDTVRPRAHGLCVRLTGNAADGADALQETQIAVWQHLYRFEARCPFPVWVLTIARNAALGVIRTRGRHHAEELDEPDTQLPPTGEFTDGVVRGLAVQHALGRLPERQREALLLWAAGMTYAQVAAAMSAPLSSVRVWIHRARTRLREDLAG